MDTVGTRSHTILLHAIAHGRAGDKGDRLNVSVIAYRPEFYPLIARAVTVERVRELFAERRPAGIVRYELPRLGALNFVIDAVLGGGVNASLNLDGHGKSLSFRLLELEIEVGAETIGQIDHLREEKP
ncbi:hypothetical protein E3C22_12105 [Jiella endophytica]|uniref:AtuA-like ferredoxin-fold domain-containing protein n=1 Tax=Jiella endophytica TaxID=2558362 RepID=A0A4Y8RLT2_9HYPH|nr:hypothetical protein [Jiella endophytica]TFF23170.1 hypothetical protein E3C22_12105 [Jiella endophytica]